MRASSSIPVETRLAASPGPPTGKNLAVFRKALLRWYDRHRRELPWRKTRDPYRIWLSEIMLQQTRVAAVVDHYRIFLKRFPNVQALAAATEDAVLAAWSGLGYYRRARRLYQCAQRTRAEARRPLPANCRSPPDSPRHRTLHRRGHRQHRLCRARGRCRWQCRACVAKIDRHQSHHATNLATCPSASREFPARRFQSGHDGTRRNRVRAPPAPLPNLPAPEMVCRRKRHNNNGAPGVLARRNSNPKPEPSDQERNQVRAISAQRPNPTRPAPEKIAAHARHVGTAATVRKSGGRRWFPSPGALSAIPSPLPTTPSMCTGRRPPKVSGSRSQTFPISPSPA